MADSPRPFPNIAPTSRSYTPGKFAQTEFKALNGATTVMRYNQRRADSTLQLGFQNITDAQAASILAHFEEVNSAWDYATFNAGNVSAGAGASLAKYLEESGGSGLRWRYSESPQVSSVQPGVSSVSCSFIGILDGN